MNAAEAGEQIGGVTPSPGGETGAAVPSTRRTSGPPPLAHRRRRRWPIWSVSQSETMCSICGWTGAHSNVCPFGPEPTRSKERR